MAESSAKIRLTLDGQQAIREADRIKKSVGGIGDQFGQMAASVGRTVAGLAAVVGMLDRATDAAMRMRQATATGSEEAGAAALRRGSAARAMRLTGAQRQAYKNIQETGAVDEATQVAFLVRLAEAGGRRVRGGAGIQYASAFSTGAFTEKELLDAAKRGKGVDIAGRLSSLSDDERVELAIRAYNIENTRNRADVASRLALIERERQRRDSPGLSAFVEGMEGAPVIGGLIRESTMDRLRRSFQRPEERSDRGEYNIFGYTRPVPVTNTRPQIGVNGEP